MRIQTNLPMLRHAKVEVFNGQDTKDGVNILIMGRMDELAKTVLKRERTRLWS